MNGKYIFIVTRKNDGVTLIEVITSMAIIGGLFIILMTIFSNNMIYVTKSGTRSKNVLLAQQEMDKKLNDIEGGVGIIGDSSIAIEFKDTNGRTIVKTINGQQINIEVGVENCKVKLQTFATD